MSNQQSEIAALNSVEAHCPKADRLAAGKALREVVPRASHENWEPNSDRPDPVTLLEQSDQGRLANLIPIRYQRMTDSPFAFFRGSAVVMAADLATTPITGIRVQASGDCHLLNFGGYATPERNIVFDLNDFDETLPAAWEWDIKRLATSFVIAGRHIHLSDKDCEAAARESVRSYREQMNEYAQMGTLEIWYSYIDVDSLLDASYTKEQKRTEKRIRKELKKELTYTQEEIIPKLTEVVNGQRRIVDTPPLIYHLPPQDLLEEEVEAAIQQYRQALPDDLHVLFDRYRLVDITIKVVGVGSVGTRCAIALFMAGEEDFLFLQVKEARPSVLTPYVGKSVYQNQGQRVVVGQRIMQAASDMFLGWTRSRGSDFYVRQLRDVKLSVDVEDLPASELIRYAALCGITLARAHACSSDPVLLSGYLGKSDGFDRAIASFALRYADQTEQDYAALVAAVDAGRLPIQR
jgi:uncharacterized protein (DUF2252 family)